MKFVKKGTVTGTTTANGNLNLGWSVDNWIPIYANVRDINDVIAIPHYFSNKSLPDGYLGVHIMTTLANPTALTNTQVTVDVWFIDRRIYEQT